VDKTDAKFLIIFVYRDFNIAFVLSVASATSFLFLSGLFLNVREIRNLVVPKIGAPGDYLKFIASANTNLEPRPTLTIFIPNKLTGTQ
jgi:hypothetical protein